MYGHLEQLAFVVCMLDLLRSHNLVLVQDFDRIKPQVMFTAYYRSSQRNEIPGHTQRTHTKMNASEAACPYSPHHREVIKTIPAFRALTGGKSNLDIIVCTLLDAGILHLVVLIPVRALDSVGGGEGRDGSVSAQPGCPTDTGRRLARVHRRSWQATLGYGETERLEGASWLDMHV